MLANSAVVLTEKDVPGASLGTRRPEELTVSELKRWLACRGASRQGRKAELVKRVKDYLDSDLGKRIVDPDKGENMEVKRRRVGIAPGNSLPAKAPSPSSERWNNGLSVTPNLRYCQVYDYLVASKVITSDGAEMKALKSMKAVKYFKEGYVQGLRTCTSNQHYFVSSQTKASMKQILYQVEICLERATADILAAQCSCPAGE